jgi:hypothetical protein
LAAPSHGAAFSLADRKPAMTALTHAANAGRHSLAERGDDLYETPPQAVRALLQVERIPQIVWEPACGPGSIVTVLRNAGHTVFASDLVDYGCPDSQSRIDFLMERTAPAGVEAIVTNPPYRLAEQFVEHALKLCPRVVMLLRLAFLESERRSPFLDRGQLARVCVFKNRLPMMHRAGWTGPRASSAIAFAWFCWDCGHRGPPTIDRISWVPCQYDSNDDIAKSVAEGFRAIKARKAAGGPGWGEHSDYPDLPPFLRRAPATDGGDT